MGQAMILHFGAQRATRDVDVLVLRADLGGLRQAVRAIASHHDLPEDWMNEAAKGFADILPPDFERRLVRLDLPLQHLRLSVLGRPEQAAKIQYFLQEQGWEIE